MSHALNCAGWLWYVQLRYTFPKYMLLQEPVLVVTALYLLFLLVIIYVRLDFAISKVMLLEEQNHLNKMLRFFTSNCILLTAILILVIILTAFNAVRVPDSVDIVCIINIGIIIATSNTMPTCQSQQWNILPLFATVDNQSHSDKKNWVIMWYIDDSHWTRPSSAESLVSPVDACLSLIVQSGIVWNHAELITCL